MNYTQRHLGELLSIFSQMIPSSKEDLYEYCVDELSCHPEVNVLTFEDC